MHNSARFVTGTSRPMFHPMIHSMPTAPSIGSQNRMSLTQPTGASFGTPTSFFTPKSYSVMIPCSTRRPEPPFDAAYFASFQPGDNILFFLHHQFIYQDGCSTWCCILVSTSDLRGIAQATFCGGYRCKMGPFGGTGSHLPNDHTPSYSPLHDFPCGLLMFSIASDSPGSPFMAVPNHLIMNFMMGISYAASHSSSSLAGSSSPIDLQQGDRGIATEQDETHASPAPGLLLTLAAAASVALTKLPSSSHQQQNK